MGQSTSNQQAPDTNQQAPDTQIKHENAELRRQILEMKQQMTMLETDNKLQNVVLRSKEQMKITKAKQIDDSKQEIDDLTKQNQTDNIQHDKVKEELIKLQKQNEDRMNELQQKENRRVEQQQMINNMKNKIHSLEKEKEEMKDNIDLIKYLEPKQIQYPITLKLKNHKLFCKSLQRYDQVKLLSLTSNKEWNGRIGRISGSFVVAKQRWPVQLLNEPKGWGLIQTHNLVLHKRGSLSEIPIGTTITIEECHTNDVRLGYPYNAWYSAPNCTIYKQIQNIYFADEKITILSNILQVNDDSKIRELLMNSGWNVNIAIDEYYKNEFNKETKGIKYIYVWQWIDDDNKWKGYDEIQNDMIEGIQIGGIYRFSVGAHNYIFHRISMDFGEQTNVKTNKKRQTKRIKVKQCEESKYPQFWSDEGCTYHDFDNKDLYYMSSEILPIEQDYIKPKLVQLNLSWNMAKQIMDGFHSTAIKSKYRIIKIESVQNRYLWDKYYAAKNAMKKSIGKNKLNEMNLWHGTDIDTIQKIISLGFRKEFNFTCYYGEGTYFALNAGYSVGYCKSSRNVFQMLYCKVLCGESSVGSKDKTLTNWPIKNDGSGQIYDSLVNSMTKPVIWVIHDDARVYPMFIVYFTKI